LLFPLSEEPCQDCGEFPVFGKGFRASTSGNSANALPNRSRTSSSWRSRVTSTSTVGGAADLSRQIAEAIMVGNQAPGRHDPDSGRGTDTVPTVPARAA
jgi:hypothetical protein